jgi:hypothetical protein
VKCVFVPATAGQDFSHQHQREDLSSAFKEPRDARPAIPRLATPITH